MTGEGTVALAGAAAAGAVAVRISVAVVRRRRERAVRGRLGRVFGSGDVAPRRQHRLREWFAASAGRPGRALRERWFVPAVGLTGFVLVGGVPGCLVGAVAAYGVHRWRRSRSVLAVTAEGDEAVSRQLPMAADLLAACLAAGAGPCEAADAVGRSLGGPVGDRLARTAAELRLGGEPATAWGRLGALAGARGLARCLERAQATGSPAVQPVTRVAAECRAEQARTATARARRAGVLATAPLGLCFLPAFLTVGVAPVLIGLATGLLNGH
ncbi:type II secretion system F family protein [Streptomyces sp. NPDC001922]|uniref:type II secretion system F family protein n=1 Tax=Streptomyces sp. NPDC001922 TaxID=3364624 RepID=UPI0036C4B206